MAPHSSTLAWKIPGWRSLVGCSPWVANSWTQLSDFTFTFHFYALEKEMATHSSVLACRIPGTGEPGRLPSMGSHRVGHNWSDLAAAYQSGANWLNLKSRLVSSATNTMLAVIFLWWQSFIRSPWPRSLEPSREQWFLQLVVCFGRHTFVVFQKRSFTSKSSQGVLLFTGVVKGVHGPRLSLWGPALGAPLHSSVKCPWNVPWDFRMGGLGLPSEVGSTLEWGSLGEGNGNPLQDSCLRNPMEPDRL